MRWFSGLPATLSSAVEGFRMDAIQKSNPKITWADILARTPSRFIDWRGATRGALTVTALSNKTTRFRRQAGVLSWEVKDADCNRVCKDFFRQLMGVGCIQANNTSSFGRDLTRQEVKMLEQAIEDHRKAIQARRRIKHAAAALNQPSQPSIWAQSALNAY